LHVAVVLGVEKGGMGIEASEHAVDGILDEHLRIGLLDVAVAYDLESLTEPIKRAIELRTLRAHRLAVADVEKRRCAGNAGQHHIGPKPEICFADHVLRPANKA